MVENSMIALIEDVMTMKNAQQLRSIIENCAEIILVLDVNGIIEYANRSAEKILGYEISELVGMEFASLIHPKCLEAMERSLDEAIKEHKSVRFQKLEILCKDGNWASLEGTATGIVDESSKLMVALGMVNLTEHMRRIHALEEKAEYFDLLTETAEDMIYVLDENLIIRFVNRYGATVFGKTPEALIGKHMEALFPPNIASSYRKNIEGVFREGKPVNLEEETIFLSGKAWINTWLIPIKDEDGRVIQVLGLSRDITSKKEAKIQLEQRTQQAEEASIRAQEFFDYLAHDIANLVAPIMTYAEAIAQKEDTSQETKKYSHSIIEQVKEIAIFLLNLRTLSEVQKTDISRVEALDLAECLSEIVKSIEDHYPNRKFRLHFEKPSQIQVLVVGGKYVRNMLAVELDRAARYAHNQDIDVWITIYPVTDELGSVFWEMKMEILHLALPSKFREMLSTPFNLSAMKSGRRKASRNLSFLASVVEHFGGKLWFEDASPGSPEMGFSMKIRLPKAFEKSN